MNPFHELLTFLGRHSRTRLAPTSPLTVLSVRDPPVPMYIQSSDSANTLQDQLTRGFPSTSTAAPIPTTAAMTDSRDLVFVNCNAPSFDVSVRLRRSDAPVSTANGSINPHSSVADTSPVTNLTTVPMCCLEAGRLDPGTVTQLKSLYESGSPVTFHPDSDASDIIRETLRQNTQSDGSLSMTYHPSDAICAIASVVVPGYFATAGNETADESRVVCDLQFNFQVPTQQLASAVEAIPRNDATQQGSTAASSPPTVIVTSWFFGFP